MAQKSLYNIIHSVHLFIICRFRAWKTAILSSSASNMPKELVGQPPPWSPDICDHLSLHILSRAHVVSPKVIQTFCERTACVFLFILFSHSKGRPASPCTLPENRISPMPGSAQNMWLEGCDDRQPSSLGTSVLSVPGILRSKIHSAGLQDSSAVQNCL